MPRRQVLQPCDARARGSEALAEAIGVLSRVQARARRRRRAYEVRLPTAARGLKFGRRRTCSTSAARSVHALRVRGYPVPAALTAGDIDGTEYEITQRRPAHPIEQITEAHMPPLVALVDHPTRRRPAGPPALDRGYGHEPDRRLRGALRARRACELDNPALLDRLQDDRDEVAACDVASHDVVHYDFSPYNVLAEGDRITGVVDWQGATSGDAAFDLVTLADYTHDFALRDRLLDAARTLTSPRALRLYGAHMVLRQVDWSLRRQDDTAVWWSTGMGEALLEALAE